MKKLFALTALCMAASAANAGTVTCGGTVQYMGYHANNEFMIQLSSMNTPVFFCNPEITWSVPGTSYTTGPNTCKALIAMFTAAKASGASISGIYFDGNDVPSSCTSFALWARTNIRYFVF